MVSADESRPETGPGQVKGNAKASKPSGNKASGHKASGKAAEKRRKSSQKPDLKPEATVVATESVQHAIEQDAIEQAEQPMMSTASDAVTADTAAVISAEPQAPERQAPAPVSARTITDAYGDYTRKSIEQTSSFFAQLAGARSPNKAFELQTEFARTAFETFVDESRKIREMHRELAKQRLKGLEGLVMGRRAAR